MRKQAIYDVKTGYLQHKKMNPESFLSNFRGSHQNSGILLIL